MFRNKLKLCNYLVYFISIRYIVVPIINDKVIDVKILLKTGVIPHNFSSRLVHALLIVLQRKQS